MNKEFLPFELSVKLKELGFNEPCLATIHSKTKQIIGIYGVYKEQPRFEDFYINAPLWQQAFDFFREKGFDFCVARIHNKTDLYHFHIDYEWVYFEGTYEEARLECLKKLIEM